MTFTPSPQQAARHSRDQGLVSEPASQAAGVPAVRLCRFRQIDDHGACHRGARARRPKSRTAASRRCPVRRLHRQGGAGDDAQGHTGIDHPQPDLRVSEATPEEIARGRAGGSRPARQPREPAAGGAVVRDGADQAASSCASATFTSHASCSMSNRCCARPSSSCSTRSRWSARRWRADLLAFGKPILVLGDPGQLPPIKGAGAFTEVAPDVMLTEIHRQAGESAIIRLATMARQGVPIPLRRARRLRLEDAPHRRRARAAAARRPGDLRPQRNAAAPQRRDEACRGLCRRATRWARREDHLPQEPQRPRLGERHVRISWPTSATKGRSSSMPTLTTEDGVTIAGRHRFYKGHYDDHVHLDPERSRRDWKAMRGLIETVWGYAITCHKAKARSGRTSSSMTTASAARPRIGRAGFIPRSRAPNRG